MLVHLRQCSLQGRTSAVYTAPATRMLEMASPTTGHKLEELRVQCEADERDFGGNLDWPRPSKAGSAAVLLSALDKGPF